MKTNQFWFEKVKNFAFTKTVNGLDIEIPPVPAMISVSAQELNTMVVQETWGHFPTVPHAFAIPASMQAPWFPYGEKSFSFPSFPAPHEPEEQIVCISQRPTRTDSGVDAHEGEFQSEYHS